MILLWSIKMPHHPCSYPGGFGTYGRYGPLRPNFRTYGFTFLNELKLMAWLFKLNQAVKLYVRGRGACLFLGASLDLKTESLKPLAVHFSTLFGYPFIHYNSYSWSTQNLTSCAQHLCINFDGFLYQHLTVFFESGHWHSHPYLRVG